LGFILGFLEKDTEPGNQPLNKQYMKNFGSFSSEVSFAEFKRIRSKDSDEYSAWLRVAVPSGLVSMRYVGTDDLSELIFGTQIRIDCVVGISQKDYAEVIVSGVSLNR